MAEIKYMLEITMESKASWTHKYIKRSFAAQKGAIDIGKYGKPYSRYGIVEVGDFFTEQFDEGVKVVFEGEEIKVYLNSFATVKKEYREIFHPHSKEPHPEWVTTTFYLYIE